MKQVSVSSAENDGKSSFFHQVELEQLYRSAPFGICLLDCDLRYIRINERLASLNGKPVAEHIGRTVREIIPELADQIEPICRKVLETGEPILDLEFQDPSPVDTKLKKDWSVSYYPVLAENNEVYGVGAIVQDVSRRKTVEESLRQSEERFREMAENIREVFWLFDYAEQRVIYASPAYEEIWGRSIQALYDRYDDWAESIHPDDVSFAQESFARIIETGGGEAREYRIVRPDGSIRWISDRGFAIYDEDGKVRRITGIAEDITERKETEKSLEQTRQDLERLVDDRTASLVSANQRLYLEVKERSAAQESLRESEKRYRALFEWANDGIVTLKEDKFTDCNQKALELVGRDKEKLIGETPAFISPLRQPDGMYSSEKAQDILAKAYKGMPLTFEWVCTKPDGTPIDLEVSLTKVEVGEESTLLALWRDISERKQADRDIRDLLHFERIIAELSSRFVNIEADRIDEEIDRAVQLVVNFMGVDRSTVMELSSDKKEFLMVHSFALPGVQPLSTMIINDEFQWCTGKIRQGETVLLTRLPEDLPEEAERERKYFKKEGLKSCVIIPLKVGGSVLGAMAFSSLHSDRHWSYELVQRLRLLGQIFAYALARKRAEEGRDRRLRFEKLLAELSAGFVNLPASEIDREVEKGLGLIVEFLDLDRGALFEISDDKTKIHVTHTYTANGVEQDQPIIMTGNFPWFAKKMIQENMFLFSRVNDLPEEAVNEKEFFLAKGIKSVISVPLKIAGSVLGVVSFTSLRHERKWPDELVRRLRLVGEVFANALVRKRTEEALRSRKEQLRDLAGKLLTAQEEERRRLARELHDDLTQRLAVQAIEIGKIELQNQDIPQGVLLNMRDIQSELVKISEDVHSISRQLHPSILDDLGLVDALRAECDSFSQREGIFVQYDLQPIAKNTPKEFALGIYRVAQESLRNIAKHAQAERAFVSLQNTNSTIILTLKDTGIGFEPDQAKGKGSLGLASMEERMRLIDGELLVQSQPGQGTMIEARVSLTRSSV